MFLMFLFMLLPVQSPAQSVLITAHRGASGHAPENTLPAIQKALEIGVDRIEVDVQQTADGVVVCLHDKTLNRTTDAHGQVGGKTWEELDSVQANVGFEERYPNVRIPSLEQVFELLDGSVQFVIEIKDGNRTYPGIEDHVAELIKKNNAQDWAVVHSFNDRVLNHLHRHHPNIRLQKLLVSKPSWLPFMLDFRLHVASLKDYMFVEAFGVSLSGTTRHLVDNAHRLGKKVHVWTVNRPQDMERMIKLGVDGLITNFPDEAKKVVSSKKEP